MVATRRAFPQSGDSSLAWGGRANLFIVLGWVACHHFCNFSQLDEEFSWESMVTDLIISHNFETHFEWLVVIKYGVNLDYEWLSGLV